MRIGNWSSFGNSACGATDGQQAIVARIADGNITTYAGRKANSAKYFLKKDGRALRVDAVDKTDEQISAEAKGSSVERG